MVQVSVETKRLREKLRVLGMPTAKASRFRVQRWKGGFEARTGIGNTVARVNGDTFSDETLNLLAFDVKRLTTTNAEVGERLRRDVPAHQRLPHEFQQAIAKKLVFGTGTPEFKLNDAAGRGIDAYYADRDESLVGQLRARILDMGACKDAYDYHYREKRALTALALIERAMVEAPPQLLMRRSGKPPIAQHLKDAGDVLGRHADGMYKKGARHGNHYAMNQLAHWLWRLSGAEK